MKLLRLIVWTARPVFALGCFAVGLYTMITAEDMTRLCVACILLWQFMFTKWEEAL